MPLIWLQTRTGYGLRLWVRVPSRTMPHFRTFAVGEWARRIWRPRVHLAGELLSEAEFQLRGGELR